MLKKRISPIFLFIFLWLGTFLYAVEDHNNEPNYRYKLSIAALFQNETFFMKEWIEYHRMVGVEHFLLYNNNSTDNWQAILDPYIKEGLVEVINWTDSYYLKKNGKKAQQLIYKDAIVRNVGVSRWVALIDLDEFLFPKAYATVTELLDKHFASFDAICVNWQNFGTSCKTLAVDDSVLFSLTQASILLHKDNLLVKSILRPEAVDHVKSSNIHWYILKKGFVCVDGHGSVLTSQHMKGKEMYDFSNEPCSAAIQVNHYRFGDEWYWHTIKGPRLLQRFGAGERYDSTIVLYHDCNVREESYAIGNYIEKYHPEKYKKLWRDGKFKREFYYA